MKFIIIIAFDDDERKATKRRKQNARSTRELDPSRRSRFSRPPRTRVSGVLRLPPSVVVVVVVVVCTNFIIYDFFCRANEPANGFFLQLIVRVYEGEIKKKILLFCPKLHKKISRISLTTKGDILLSRARINTHTEEALFSFYCRCRSVFARSFFSSSSLSLRLFLLPPREKVKEASE